MERTAHEQKEILQKTLRKRKVLPTQRDNKNLYFILIFTSSKGPKRKRLKHSIEPKKVKVSFVHNEPKIAKRRELGGKELVGMKIHRDDKSLIKSIKSKK